MKASAKLAVLSVTALGALATAAPANAETVVPCGGGKGAETVSGSMSVAAGETCVLDGTTVTGNVYAAAGSSVFLLYGTVNGNVRVGEGAYLDATGGGIHGTVTALTATGVRLAGGVQVGGSVRSYSSDASNSGFVFTDGATIDGALDVVAPGEVLVERSNIGTNVRGIGSQYTHLFNSTVGGNVTVKENPRGAVVCGSTVAGDGTFAGNSGRVQLGAGEVFSCTSTNNWEDDLVVSYNTANLTVTNNVVVDDLSGACNNPAPTGSNNQVGGTKSGQFKNL